jgi:hypothetical protein
MQQLARLQAGSVVSGQSTSAHLAQCSSVFMAQTVYETALPAVALQRR